MKKFYLCITVAFLALLGACSDDDSSSTSVDITEFLAASNSSDSASDSVNITTETVYDTVTYETSDEDPYYLEDTTEFDWGEDEDEEEESSSSVAASSASVEVNADSLTDSRDGSVYALVTVENAYYGNVVWMAENLAYEIDGASYCYDGDCDNGTLYTYAALETACPSGWRLPTRDDFNIAASTSDFPWTFGGRMKVSDGETEYGYLDQMGFFWADTSETYDSSDTDVDNCESDECAMMFVKKSESYDGIGEYFMQQDEQSKGFSIRCVMDEE